LAAAIPAAAQTAYPNKPITIVVPFPAGGTADLLPRLVAEELKPVLGQHVMIVNRPGASGNIGLEFVARAEPDGYTLISAPQLTFSVNHLLNPQLKIDPRKLQAVSVMATYPTVLFGRGDLPADSLEALVAQAKERPGKITYASQGRGQIGHLTLAGLAQRAKIEMLHVPYRGSAPAIQDLVSGQVDLLADNLLSGMQHVQAGKLKILAVGGKSRLPAYPDVKTMGETIPGFVSDTWMAIAAPAGTPKDVVAKLSGAIAQVLKGPALRKRIEELQVEPFGSTPEQMEALIKESHDRWAPVIQDAKITAE
ncbi:MAG TPA: tripartite tricarboxylate transporter substrate binding protein, partial [Beijerinckiaceae bacterium]